MLLKLMLQIVITAPEIEMLIILNEGNIQSIKKSNKKPSEFCKTELKYKM